MCAALVAGGNMLPAQETAPMLTLDNGTQMPLLGVGTFLASPDDAYKMLERLGLDYVDLLYVHQSVDDYLGVWRDMEKALAQCNKSRPGIFQSVARGSANVSKN